MCFIFSGVFVAILGASLEEPLFSELVGQKCSQSIGPVCISYILELRRQKKIEENRLAGKFIIDLFTRNFQLQITIF